MQHTKLFGALTELLRAASKNHTFIALIDGLDEFEEDDWLDLIEQIKSLAPLVKICVGSRKEAVFENAFGKWFDMRPGHRE